MTAALDHATLALIEEHVRRLLTVMGFADATVQCRVQEVVGAAPAAPAHHLTIAIDAGEAGRALIGAHGSNLEALQHVVRSLMRRELPGVHYVVVDVNGYRARRERSLLQLAETAAQRAQHTGRTVVLRPMGAADRRVLHTALAARGDVQTESMGEEPNRRVIVRPIFL